MKLLARFRSRDRRKPENAQRRELHDELKRQIDVGQKLVVEHQLAHARQQTDENSARIAFLRKQAGVMRRA